MVNESAIAQVKECGAGLIERLMRFFSFRFWLAGSFNRLCFCIIDGIRFGCYIQFRIETGAIGAGFGQVGHEQVSYIRLQKIGYPVQVFDRGLVGIGAPVGYRAGMNAQEGSQFSV